MAQNTAPIYPIVPSIQWGTPVTTANTAMDGTGTVVTVFTADAVDGSRCDEIKLKPIGTNVATVARFFINNGLTNATAANNVFFAEITLPATTASATVGLPEYAIPGPRGMDPGFKINMTIGTTVASGWVASAYGGHY
jgi:hypothetical protein